MKYARESIEKSGTVFSGVSSAAGMISRRGRLLPAVVAACAALAWSNASFGAVYNTLQLSAADPLNVPYVSYDAALGVVSITGSFTLTGENGVMLAPGETGPATLTLTGFNPNGAAYTGLPGLIIQDLISGPASFTIDDASNNLLLAGTALDAVFSLSTGSSPTGGLFSINSVTYTSGPILTDFMNANYTNPGSFSFTLTSFDAGEPSVVGNTLQSFTASIGGVFAASPSGVPEPASLALLAIGAVSLFVRRRV